MEEKKLQKYLNIKRKMYDESWTRRRVQDFLKYYLAKKFTTKV